MVRSVKKPAKRICTLCKKYRVKITLKRGGKRVYKKESVLRKQLRRKMKGRSKFGSSCQSGYNPMSLFGKRRRRGVKRRTTRKRTTKRRTTRKRTTKRRTTRKRTTRRRSGFGKTTQIRKLHKLCKVYGVKIGRKSPSVLRKQCLKKAKTMLKKMGRRSRLSRFGFNPLRAAAQLTPGGQLFIDSNAKVELKKLKAQQATGTEQRERDETRRRQETRDAAAAEERKTAREAALRREEREDKRREKEEDERKEEKKLRQAKQEREEDERREMKKMQLQHEMEEKAHQRELEKAAALAKLGALPTTTTSAAFGKRRRGRPGRPRKVGRPRKAGRR
jgi:hypothetical protein